MANMNEYLKNKLYSGATLPPNTRFEEVVVDIDFRDYNNDGEVTPVRPTTPDRGRPRRRRGRTARAGLVNDAGG